MRKAPYILSALAGVALAGAAFASGAPWPVILIVTPLPLVVWNAVCYATESPTARWLHLRLWAKWHGLGSPSDDDNVDFRNMFLEYPRGRNLRAVFAYSSGRNYKTPTLQLADARLDTIDHAVLSRDVEGMRRLFRAFHVHYGASTQFDLFERACEIMRAESIDVDDLLSYAEVCGFDFWAAFTAIENNVPIDYAGASS